MGYDMTGTVKVVLEEQTFASGFNKREFVVTVEDGKYPQEICFETVKDKTKLLDDLSVGDNVTVSFDIRGREYNGKYYTNLNAWKISKGGAGGGNSGGSSGASAGGNAAAGQDSGGGGIDAANAALASSSRDGLDDDDIPF